MLCTKCTHEKMSSQPLMPGRCLVKHQQTVSQVLAIAWPISQRSTDACLTINQPSTECQSTQVNLTLAPTLTTLTHLLQYWVILCIIFFTWCKTLFKELKLPLLESKHKRWLLFDCPTLIIPVTPKSDQFQISPADSPDRTWLFML